MSGVASADFGATYGQALPTVTDFVPNTTVVAPCVVKWAVVDCSTLKKDEHAEARVSAAHRLQVHLSTEEFCSKEDWMKQEMSLPLSPITRKQWR